MIVCRDGEKYSIRTLFTPGRCLRARARLLAGNGIDQDLVYQELVQEAVTRYATPENNTPENKDYKVPGKNRRKPIADYIVNSVKFVVATNWGFESSVTGAPWKLPSKYPPKNWGQTKPVDVHCDFKNDK